MPYTKSQKIWMNGEFVDWDKAQVHVLTHALHYGSSVFEGMRCYKTKNGSAVFRLAEHMERLVNSAKIYKMAPQYSVTELVEAVEETIRKNEMDECYVRPLVYRGFGDVGVNPKSCPIETMIAVWGWGAYLGAGATEDGVDVMVSSWQRFAPNTLPAMSKCAANYMNSQLAKLEAIDAGFVEGILVNTNGHVCEGSGENIFVVWRDQIMTPPLSSSILPGLTRDSIIKLAKDKGYDVVEQELPRELLYVADEVFFTGSAAEVTPIRSVDRHVVGAGKRGPITKELQEHFSGITSGEREDVHGWLHYVTKVAV